MSSTTLPDQADWPDCLFRVTSTITYKRTPATNSFASPVTQRLGRHPTLKDAFLAEDYFYEKVRLHLKSFHVFKNGDPFDSPFISVTTSLRFALSVAELHGQRGGKDVTITLIDTSLIARLPPIWNAEELAHKTRLDRSKEDLWDEFLVFDYVGGPEKAFKTVNYLDLVQDLGRLIPAFLQKDDSKRERFSTFWKRIPNRGTPFKPVEVALAFQIARSMATDRLTIVLMIMILFLEKRVSYGPACINEIVELVQQHTRQEDIRAAFSLILRPTNAKSSATNPGATMNVYDFLDKEYRPPVGSSSLEVQYVNWCLVRLRQQLDSDQAAKVKEFVMLSPTALVACTYTHGDAQQIVKLCDRSNGGTQKIFEEFAGASELGTAFFDLRRAVRRCTVNPLLRLKCLLKEAKAKEPRDEGLPVIRFWAHQFEQIEEKLRPAVPEERQSGMKVEMNRSTNVLEDPVQPVRKRRKIETTKIRMPMTVTRTVEDEPNEESVPVKEERVSW